MGLLIDEIFIFPLIFPKISQDVAFKNLQLIFCLFITSKKFLQPTKLLLNVSFWSLNDLSGEL